MWLAVVNGRAEAETPLGGQRRAVHGIIGQRSPPRTGVKLDMTLMRGVAGEAESKIVHVPGGLPSGRRRRSGHGRVGLAVPDGMFLTPVTG